MTVPTTLAAERASFAHASRVCNALRRAVNPEPVRRAKRGFAGIRGAPACHSNGLGALGVTLRPSERRKFRQDRAAWSRNFISNRAWAHQ